MRDRKVSADAFLPHQGLSGAQIEDKSMEIISRELGPHSFQDGQLPVVLRVIHATADFDFGKNLRFHPSAVDAGIKALRAGKPIVTDVSMVAAGISLRASPVAGVRVITPIGTEECRKLAADRGITRAAAAMIIGFRQSPGILAIGNAPTALLEALRLVDTTGFVPDLIVGVPVGFVNAEESKELLALQARIPYITALGRKGGSPVAAAIVNALIRQA